MSYKMKHNFKVGDKYKIYYNPKNINNRKIEIRAIIDDSIMVYITEKGNYIMEDISFMLLTQENGYLIKL